MKAGFIFLIGILFVVTELSYCDDDDEQLKTNVENCLKKRGVDIKKFENETVTCTQEAAQDDAWAKKFCAELKETQIPPCYDKDTLQHLEECVKNEKSDASFTKELVDFYKSLCKIKKH